MIVGTGIDIVEIERFRKILAGSGERFLKRVFTSEEQSFCMARKDPAPHFAARSAKGICASTVMRTKSAMKSGSSKIHMIKSLNGIIREGIDQMSFMCRITALSSPYRFSARSSSS